MNFQLILMACCILSVAVMSIASTSIAQECYDKNSSFADTKKTNKSYLIYMLVAGILCVIVSFGGMYLGFKGMGPSVALKA